MYQKFVERIFRVGPIEYLCAAIFAVLVALVFANVVMRYLLSAPVFWSDEIARYLFIWFSFFGALLALKRQKQYSIDYFVNLLPRPATVVVSILGDAAVFCILVLLVRYGYEVNVRLSFQTSPSVGLPIYYVYAALPVVGVLMAGITILELIEKIRVHVLGRPPILPERGPGAV
jgi:TRAP-type transport system small permease protein